MTTSSVTALSSARFVNFAPIGRGGFAEVFSADDTVLRRKVAIKRYFRPASELQSIRESLLRCAKLSHPHIAQMLDLCEHSGQLLLIQNYCAEGTLAEKLETGQLERSAAIQHFLEVADAVSYLHGLQLLHRDLKLSNVLLDAGGRAIVVDFDQCVSFATGLQGAPSGAAFAGTPAYMAPELIRGKAAASVATEVYALGVMLFELLSGELLTNKIDRAHALADSALYGFELSEGMGRHARDWNAIIGKATHMSPANRYSDVAALIRDIQCQIESKPISARQLGRRERIIRWGKRYPLTAGLATTSLCLILTVGVLSAVAWAKAWKTQTLADRNTQELELKLQQVKEAESKLEELIQQVEAELTVAQVEERKQLEATRSAQQTEDELGTEAQRTEQLRTQAEQALAQAQATQSELESKERESSVVAISLAESAADVALRSYVTSFRQAWRAVQEGQWQQAKNLATQLSEGQRGLEYRILSQAITARIRTPAEIVVGTYYRGTEPTSFESNSLLSLTTDNAFRKLEFQTERRNSLGRTDGLKLRVAADLPQNVADGELALMELQVAPIGTGVDRILGVLHDGTIVTSRPRDKRDDRRQDIVVSTFNPGAYAAGDKLHNADSVAQLMKSNLPLEVAVEELVTVSKVPFTSKHNFKPFHDGTNHIIDNLAMLKTADWEGQHLSLQWLGQIQVQPLACENALYFQMRNLSANIQSISKDRNLLVKQVDRPSNPEEKLVQIDMNNGRFFHVESDSWDLRSMNSCFDADGNILLTGPSVKKGGYESPLRLAIRDHDRYLEPVQSMVNIGFSRGICCPTWADSDHLYVDRSSGIDRISLPLNENSQVEKWLRLGNQHKNSSWALSSLIDVGRILISLTAKNKGASGYSKATILIDRQRSGMWLCDHVLGPVAVVPDSGELVTFDSDGKLFALQFIESPQIPENLTSALESAAQALSAAAELEGTKLPK